MQDSAYGGSPEDCRKSVRLRQCAFYNSVEISKKVLTLTLRNSLYESYHEGDAVSADSE